MEAPKTWQNVLLRREYLRGWRAGWDDACSHECGSDVEEMESELTSLEALKPCPECGAEGYVYFARECDGEGSMGPCNFCLGMGIARQKQEDEDTE
jgi:hypothetical protein